ncbi:MAG: N4-gp56 family major capsid protein [Alphaproteobacteria bacterium]|nr:N4-gp56 family major capsid protein [Alphaproteobacteria bacterium]MCW5741602.1 N4-gp56 family major capsid protein [Alphaproteobacteria bacterium]
MNTTSTVPDAVSTFYDRTLLTKAKPLLVHTKWGQVRDIPRNNTDNIRFRRYSLLSAATDPLVEGVTPSLASLSVTNVDATVQQYGNGVLITDKLNFTTQDPLLTEVADILGENAANTLDQLTRDELATTTTIQYASTATANNEVTSAMKITKAEVQEAVRTLKVNNAKKVTSMVSASDGFNTSPLDACFIGIVHPNTTYDLKNIPGFIRVEEYGQRTAMPGEVGALDEVRFIETTNAKVYSAAGSGSIDVYGTIIMAADFYAVSRISGEAMKNIVEGPGGNSDPLHQRQTSAWKATFVATILNDAFGLSLRHAVSS